MPQRNRGFNCGCEASVMDGFTVSRVSRRQFLVGAGAAGLGLAAGPLTGTASASTSGAGATADVRPDGTPEQVHLTWGNDPSREVIVSWASPAPSRHPRVWLRPGR